MDGVTSWYLNHNAVAQLQMTTAAMSLLLLSSLAASETRGSGDETDTFRMIGLFDLQEVLGLRALASGRTRDRRLALEASRKRVARQNGSSFCHVNFN